jgi:hypothetical protein
MQLLHDRERVDDLIGLLACFDQRNHQLSDAVVVPVVPTLRTLCHQPSGMKRASPGSRTAS